MRLTGENERKPNFGPHFSPSGPNLGPLNFVMDLTSTSG